MERLSSNQNIQESLLEMWPYVFKNGTTNYSLARGILLMMYPPFLRLMEKLPLKYENVDFVYRDNLPAQTTSYDNDGDAFAVSEKWDVIFYTKNFRTVYIEALVDSALLLQPRPVRINEDNPSLIPDLELEESNDVILAKVNILASIEDIQNEIEKAVLQIRKKRGHRPSRGRPRGFLNLGKEDARLFMLKYQGKTASTPCVKELLKDYPETNKRAEIFRDLIKKLKLFVDPPRSDSKKEPEELDIFL